MKNKQTKLHTSKETLRRLTHELGVVAGGTLVAPSSHPTCPASLLAPSR